MKINKVLKVDYCDEIQTSYFKVENHEDISPYDNAYCVEPETIVQGLKTTIDYEEVRF